MDHERLAMLALHLIPGVGSFTVRQLISYCGSATDAFRQSRKKLLRIPGVGPGIVEALRKEAALQEASEIFFRAHKKKISLHFHLDNAFPERLRHIPDSPSLIYYQGNASLNNPKTIAIVGTRKATPYGKDITRELVEGLARHNPTIISGLAYGIDAVAHSAALKNGLETVAVMAGGIEYIYPAIHRKLARDIRAHGALITENGIDTTPDASRFPARNRIIAGMSDLILVIEAAERGGALITAAIANDYNREVMAVPGNVSQPFSAGCNNLIKRHRAHVLTCVEDIDYLMNWHATDLPVKNLPELTDDEKRIVKILKDNSGSMHLDQLSWACGKAVGLTASLLLQLEFKKVVTAKPGKIFMLT